MTQREIRAVYDKVVANYGLSEHVVYLASGGLVDVKGPMTSDVDILLMTADYNNLDHIFTDAVKKPRPDKSRCYYEFIVDGRTVSVCATDDPSAKRSIIHRKNELELLKFPLLTVCAIMLKKNGLGTEAAWAAVLGFKEGDPYEIMGREAEYLLHIAEKREDELREALHRNCGPINLG